MSYYNLPIGEQAPEIVDAFIEIPKGANNKYEYDNSADVMRLDRVLHSPMFYPVDYGFIPQTYADDGDPLDILIVTDAPVFPGCVCTVRPIGALKMSDEKGMDDKILAVQTGNPRYAQIQNLADLPPHILAEISHFFETYKTLEKKKVTVEGWHGKDAAHALIVQAHAAFGARESGKK